MSRSWPQDAHPLLTDDTCSLTSLAVRRYNCIAWAVCEDFRWWWPVVGAYWPSGVPRQETIPAFIEAFRTKGFEPCSDSSLEDGYQKIALHAKLMAGFIVPTHASRQLASGRWTSKMGRLEDICHPQPGDVDGPAYGQVILYMKRSRTEDDPIPSDPY
jgi:hypothetical protein